MHDFQCQKGLGWDQTLSPAQLKESRFFYGRFVYWVELFQLAIAFDIGCLYSM